MNFKDPQRHLIEWFQIDPRLRAILCEIEVSAYPMPMTITHLLRTEAEQEQLFKVGASPQKTSVHQFGRGADFRPFPDEEFNAWLLQEVNLRHGYDKNRPDMRTLLRHEGTKDHFHLQCIPIEVWSNQFKGGINVRRA